MVIMKQGCNSYCWIGGVGKSTIVQLIYNDKKIEKHFELRMWVCVLEEFDPRMITKAIIESATEAKCDLLDMDLMQRRLQRVIKEYLLVLDDVWSESCSKWDVLRVPLYAGASGSKIIVTTRSEVVSSIMAVGNIPAYHLKGLSDRKRGHCLIVVHFDTQVLMCHKIW